MTQRVFYAKESSTKSDKIIETQTKREVKMKTVFNNSQLCHVWASQNQEHGRNSNGSLYFNGNTIFSYGSHYTLGKIISVNGERIVLINNTSYSNTTANHQNEVSSATTHLRRFHVSDPQDLRKSAEDWQANLIDSLFDVLKSTKPHFSLEYSEPGMKFNSFCELFGFQDLMIDEQDLEDHYELLLTHVALREKRNEELNSPVNEEKRQKQREQREAAKERKRQSELMSKKFKLINWLRGENVQLGFGNDRQVNGCYLLRVKGEVIETSGGAEVPLSHGLKLLNKINNGEAKTGERVGHFELNKRIDDLVTIGCHDISLAHANRILKPFVNAGV